MGLSVHMRFQWSDYYVSVVHGRIEIACFHCGDFPHFMSATSSGDLWLCFLHFSSSSKCTLSPEIPHQLVLLVRSIVVLRYYPLTASPRPWLHLDVAMYLPVSLLFTANVFFSLHVKATCVFATKSLRFCFRDLRCKVSAICDGYACRGSLRDVEGDGTIGKDPSVAHCPTVGFKFANFVFFSSISNYAISTDAPENVRQGVSDWRVRYTLH